MLQSVIGPPEEETDVPALELQPGKTTNATPSRNSRYLDIINSLPFRNFEVSSRKAHNRVFNKPALNKTPVHKVSIIGNNEVIAKKNLIFLPL